MAKLSDTELKALLANEKADTLGSVQASKLASERTDAMNYYMGDVEKDIPTITGRSSVVSMDVMDTIHGLMPSLMEIFAGSEDAVRFEPVGPEDTEAAEQETEYVNHVFWQLNDGFKTLYSFIFDALLQKLGVVKVWWEESEGDEKETYRDLTEDEYALILESPEVEEVEHTVNEDGTHDVTVAYKKDHAQAKVEAVPPEEFGIAKRARNLRDTHYCYHEVIRNQADLIADGYDINQVKALQTYATPKTTESIARDTADETEFGGDPGMNEAMRPLRVTEHYVRMDYERNGKARLYSVTTGGEDGVILRRDGKAQVEEVDFIPFAVMTPIPMPHRIFGRSVADVVMDIQRQKTVIKRALSDNMYAVNMPRPYVSEQLTNDSTLDDLAVWRHGAPIRGKMPGAVEWQIVPFIGQHVFPMMQYLDSEREWRTGVSRQGQGLDADALNNQTATAAQQLYNASQSRMKLIARIFAETGIRDLFWLLHATVRKNAKQEATVRLSNRWVTVDPRNWKTRNDLTVTVGLGQGGKAQRMQEQMILIGLQREAMANGLTNLVAPENLYNSAREIAKLLELDVERFFKDPSQEPPPQPKPDPEMMKVQAQMQIEQQKLQVDMQKTQSEQQFKMQEMEAKAQIEQLQAQADIATNERKVQADAALAERKFELDRELKIAEFQLERELKMLDMQAKAVSHELDVEKAEMDMQTSGEKAALDYTMKAADHGRKMKESAKKEAPISGAIKKLQDQQAKASEQMAKVLEAVEADREIEIKRDAKGKAAGAVSRRKKAK
jgi:hypothetical protein